MALPASFDAAMFWSGLGGVVFAVIGVEAYNEYFDARMGTDRVFNPQDVPPVTDAVFWIGTVGIRRSAGGRHLPDGARGLAGSCVRVTRWRSGDFLRGAADPLVLSRTR